MSTPSFVVADLRTDSGELLTTLTIPTKAFRTGSRGYYINHKIEIEGKRYQVQIQLVEIGSKKVAETNDE